MTSLTEFFNKHEDDALKGISHKNSIIKRNIIAHMAVNGECTLSELTKQLHISVPTITKLVQELVEENIVTDNGKVETPGGRRPNIYGLANSAIYFVGVNVGRNIEGLDALEGVIDIVYNPARTGLMLEAERRGIPCIGGLLMLVAQAAQAVERYTGKATPRERILDVTERLSRREQNIALIGMPGSGKTRVGEQIAQLTGREHIDLDRALEERLGMPCADYIVERGEAAFREQETAALSDISKRSGLVLSTGGGVVTRDENYPLLHQNSKIVMLNRKLEELAHKGRPITARDGIDKLAEQRMPRYRAWADHIIDSRDCAANTAQALLDTLPPAL